MPLPFAPSGKSQFAVLSGKIDTRAVRLKAYIRGGSAYQVRRRRGMQAWQVLSGGLKSYFREVLLGHSLEMVSTDSQGPPHPHVHPRRNCHGTTAPASSTRQRAVPKCGSRQRAAAASLKPIWLQHLARASPTRERRSGERGEEALVGSWFCFMLAG